MPIAPGPQINFKRALTIAVIAIGVGVAVVVGLTLLSQQGGGGGLELQSSEIRAGSTNALSDSINSGGPILYSDPNEGIASVFVQKNEVEDWLAFSAHRNNCGSTLVWMPASRTFSDPCQAGIVINANGCQEDSANQLTHYETRVEGSQLILDFGTIRKNYCQPGK